MHLGTIIVLKTTLQDKIDYLINPISLSQEQQYELFFLHQVCTITAMVLSFT